MRYTPKQLSIKEEGLKHYLDRTKADHNGCGYREFAERVELQVPKTTIAKSFNIKNKQTIYKWIRIYYKEKELTK